MLILSRKLDETIMIGEQIEVKVVSIRGGVIRLGISAPESVKILRSEIIDRKASVTSDNQEPYDNRGSGDDLGVKEVSRAGISPSGNSRPALPTEKNPCSWMHRQQITIQGPATNSLLTIAS